MGQKVHPIGIRLGIVKEWLSKWYVSDNKFAGFIRSDFEIRKFIKKNLSQASVSAIIIERPGNKNVIVKVISARPGVIIGKKGGDIEHLREKISKIAGVPAHIIIDELRKPDLDSKVVADTIAQQLEKRIPFRRAMKRAVSSALKAGAKGVKICISGRLGGAEIARTEWYREGRVPLHTFRADIDYSLSEAFTTYGVIGVKVWIYKGDVINKQNDMPVLDERRK